MNELALFAGAGGGILGGKILGWRTVCAVEIDAYCRSVLLARQRDGCLDRFPIWDDVCTFDGTAWRGLDVVCGDLASLGFDAEWGIVSAENAGAPHQRKRLWILAFDGKRMANAKRMRCSAGGDTQRGQVERLASDGEARNPQGRGRIPSETSRDGACSHVADTPRIQQGRQEQRSERERVGAGGESIDVSNTAKFSRYERLSGDAKASYCQEGVQGKVGTDGGASRSNSNAQGLQEQQGQDSSGSRAQSWVSESQRVLWWQSEPDVGRVAHGVAKRVDRLKSLGNGQVPMAMALGWLILMSRIEAVKRQTKRQRKDTPCE